MAEPKCEVFFDNGTGVYYAGQTVSGRVVLTLPKEKRVRGIFLSVLGRAKVKWTESAGKTAIDYTSKIVYLDSTTPVMMANEEDSTILPAGNYTYTFVCLLPVDLPASIEHEIGRMKYVVRLKIDRPWKFDHVFKTQFTVLKHIDLNLNYALRKPTSRIVNHEFVRYSHVFGKYLPMQICVTIPQTGYKPGQDILINGTINNQSSITLKQIKIKLRKVLTFTSHTPEQKDKVMTNTIMKTYINNTAGKKMDSFCDIVHIPETPPSDFISCSIIKIGYQLYFEFRVNQLFHKNPTVTIPVIIGTIPLSQQDVTEPQLPPKKLD